jgi:hypothetical protein
MSGIPGIKTKTCLNIWYAKGAGHQFKTYDPDQKYCSRRCERMAQRKRKIKEAREALANQERLSADALRWKRMHG